MPKTWLSLPEAERLAGEITGSDPVTARAQIVEGGLNAEIAFRWRDDAGRLEFLGEQEREWLNRIDWNRGGAVLPHHPGPWASPSDYWEEFIILLIHRGSLERYFAPVVTMDSAATAQRVRKSNAGAPQKYDRAAALAECVRLADLDGLPTASDGHPDWPAVKKHLLDWFAGRDEHPGKTTIDEIVNMIRDAWQSR